MPNLHRNAIVVMAAALLVGNAIAQHKHEEHSHTFAKDVDAFHSALAPLWHAPAGVKRSQEVCSQAPKLESLARAIQSGDAKPLMASTEALTTRCRAGATDIDAALTQVHDAFHHLAEPKRN